MSVVVWKKEGGGGGFGKLITHMWLPRFSITALFEVCNHSRQTVINKPDNGLVFDAAIN